MTKNDLRLHEMTKTTKFESFDLRWLKMTKNDLKDMKWQKLQKQHND